MAVGMVGVVPQLPPTLPAVSEGWAAAAAIPHPHPDASWFPGLVRKWGAVMGGLFCQSPPRHPGGSSVPTSLLSLARSGAGRPGLGPQHPFPPSTLPRQTDSCPRRLCSCLLLPPPALLALLLGRLLPPNSHVCG